MKTGNLTRFYELLLIRIPLISVRFVIRAMILRGNISRNGLKNEFTGNSVFFTGDNNVDYG